MEPLKLEPEEREALRNLKDSNGYAAFLKVITYVGNVAGWALNTATSDHRYYQGKVHGLWDLQTTIEKMSQPEQKLEYKEPKDFAFVGKPSSTTDY